MGTPIPPRGNTGSATAHVNAYVTPLDTWNIFLDVQHRTLSTPSRKEATWYYDNMTIYIDLIFLAQRDLADEIFEMLDEKAMEIAANVVISFVVIFVVLLMCPLLFKMVSLLE